MSRWHRAWCTVPDVVVDGELLRCHTCTSAVLPDAMIAKHADKVSSSPSIPPDEPICQMNLHGPPDLPWSSTHNPEQIASPPTASDNIQARDITGASISESSPASLVSPVYKRTLNSSEIRLMYLNCGDSESPIHVSLEVYEQDSCPEYETVSYTWADEDGKSEICNVIYVGDFWDILPQTLNCWSCLHYLRPAKGVRTVWVDAICINQDDLVERGLQVAKMGEIYSLCSRVVIWLGPDIITKSIKSHRPRRRFEDIEKYGSLEDIFSRRYFTRVWIMQELLLAPYTLIPFQDKDFLAGPSTVKQLVMSVGQERWEEVGRPWLLNLNASIHLPKEDLYNSLRNMLSPDLGATDRRDIIFGILVLIRSTNILTPDYTLSLRDTVIGVSAHFLLQLMRLEILFHAGAQKSLPLYPSWVPNWNTAWFQMKDSLDQSIDTRWSNDIPQGFVGIFCPMPKAFCSSPPTTPTWGFDNSIDMSTASLTMNLAHLMKVPTRPLRDDCIAAIRTTGSTGETTNICCFVFNSPSCELMLYCDPVPFDEIVAPGIDHIFLIEHERKSRYLLLLMRKLTIPGHYRLILSWSCHDMVLVTKEAPQELPDHILESIPTSNTQFHTHVDPWRSLADAVSDVKSSCRYSPHYAHNTNRASSECMECDQALLIFEQLFPGTTWPLTFALRIFQSVLDELRDSYEIRLDRLSRSSSHDEETVPLSRRFIESVERAFGFFGHTVNEQWVLASISPRHWTDGPHDHGLWELCELQEQYFVSYSEEPGNCRGTVLGDLAEGQLVNHEFTSSLETEGLIHLRLQLRVLFDKIRLNSPFFKVFRKLRFYRFATPGNEMDMVFNKPKTDCTTIFPRCWPKAAVDELGLDGPMQQVVIE